MADKMKENKEQIFQERKQTLIYNLEKLRKRLKSSNLLDRFSLALGVLLVILSPTAYFIFRQDSSLVSVFFIYGIMMLLVPILYPVREIEIEIRDVENELDLLSISEDSIEERAEKQFKLHQLELKKYYDQTLRHSSWIFIVGLVCLFLGVAIIGITLYLVFSNSVANELSEKIILASLGAVGAILSNFIGIIYIKMYSETIKSLTEFHNRLVSTHYLHFGNFLIGKITDKTLREKTLAEIASNMAKK